MNNAIAEQFRAALNFLLYQEGRGGQVRLALAQNIDRGYLNAVIKGRKPAAEEIRLKIANHFGMTYEAMLTLGRAVEDGTVVQGQGLSQLGPSKDARSHAESLDRHQEKTKFDTLQRVLEMLDSETEYNAILNGVVEALDKAMKKRREKVDMAKRLELLEARMAVLERILEMK
jgi:plasmid maintenance system antidote protein VapI